jgi:predicted Zn-dependent protease
MLLVAALLTAAVALGPSVVATSQPGQPVPVRTVVVQPGETLWQIAARADRSGNVGDMVHRIAELNALPSTGELQIGQRIAVPIE